MTVEVAYKEIAKIFCNREFRLEKMMNKNKENFAKY